MRLRRDRSPSSNVTIGFLRIRAIVNNACIWRRLQELLAEQREGALLTASDRLAAVCAFQSVMVELCMREGAAMGTMLRIREQLGCRPAPRRTETVSV